MDRSICAHGYAVALGCSICKAESRLIAVAQTSASQAAEIAALKVELALARELIAVLREAIDHSCASLNVGYARAQQWERKR